ncbi:MAG: hypothetical protein JO309_13270 [Pseudonocardiales bacterium]|nr:hypothetical protein [Pseudonocardiales bacterium]
MTTVTGSIIRAALQAEIAAITTLVIAQEQVQTAAAETIAHLSARRRELRELLEENRR